MIYPGPDSILPGMAPGGVVIHGYSVPSQRLLFVQAIPAGWSDGDVDIVAKWNADLAMADADPATCLVAYDGDTGERLSVAAWLEP